MAFTAKDVQALREKTGCGMMDCKKALVECDGNMEAAVDFLREKGLASQAKKASRIAAEGTVAVYTTDGVGAVVEVNSETDFVANGEGFKALAAEIAQIAAEQNPADLDALLACSKDGSTVEEKVQELFLAISLRCVHCKEQFFKIYKAMEKGELKDYRIKIAISPSQQESKVIEALAATAMHDSMEKALELLAAWYETQNRKLFLLSVKKNLPMEGVKEALEAINESVEPLGVEGLPFVVLDGNEITPTIFWAKVEWEG